MSAETTLDLVIATDDLAHIHPELRGTDEYRRLRRAVAESHCDSHTLSPQEQRNARAWAEAL